MLPAFTRWRNVAGNDCSVVQCCRVATGRIRITGPSTVKVFGLWSVRPTVIAGPARYVPGRTCLNWSIPHGFPHCSIPHVLRHRSLSRAGVESGACRGLSR